MAVTRGGYCLRRGGNIKEAKVSQYCVYFLDDGGRVTGLSAALFESDAAAGRWAARISEGRSIELWSPDRKVEIGPAMASTPSVAPH
jgi:hypothetical protein